MQLKRGGRDELFSALVLVAVVNQKLGLGT
jgi:hypothetical protein